MKKALLFFSLFTLVACSEDVYQERLINRTLLMQETTILQMMVRERMLRLLLRELINLRMIFGLGHQSLFRILLIILVKRSIQVQDGLFFVLHLILVWLISTAETMDCITIMPQEVQLIIWQLQGFILTYMLTDMRQVILYLHFLLL